jgi:uncharacterized protein
MALTIMRHEAEVESPSSPATSLQNCAAIEMTARDEHDVLSFLAERPIDSAVMSGLIRDNGLQSPLNRGNFFGYRNQHGQLEGVALIGHATMVEARTAASIDALAGVVRNFRHAHLIRGEREIIRKFWQRCAGAHLEPLKVCHELMLEQRSQVQTPEKVDGLRQASLNDLKHVLAINSEMAMEEGGTNPLERDPDGFIERTARRIQQGRVWILSLDDKPIFKADIMGDTPQAVYLEGVYVHREERGKGHGYRCLSQLGRLLLARTEAICLTVNEVKNDAIRFYYKTGYRLSSYYETIYTNPRQ